ncbi:MAG: HTH domain-containing protein [Defluviitaleaceae bacterium]|nr:HTH domain-containing protein [Defluviitaleaceae bacterium]
MSAKSRRIKLIHILSVRKRDTIPSLAEKLDVSVATIHRDISELEEEGYIFETVRGNGGGVIFKGNSNPHLGKFSSEQAQDIRKIAETLEGDFASVLYGILDIYT